MVEDEEGFTFTIRWKLDQAMRGGRYSQGLVDQLEAHLENRTANVFQIISEIETLEGAAGSYPSRTKPMAKFRGRSLKGLWHKHYTQAHFMGQNLINHWGSTSLTDLLAEMDDGVSRSPKDFIGRLSHRIVHDGYLERGNVGALTGEWIVFAQQDGESYYLTLGSHDEEDAAIWDRCVSCKTDFPELGILQIAR